MQEQQDKPLSMSDKVNIGIAVVQIISHMVELFLRRPGTFGSRYVGFQFVLSWLFLFFFPVFFQREDPRPLLAFWVASTVMLLVHRIAGGWRQWYGHETHSRSGGESWFSGSFTARCVKELLALIALAIGAFSFSAPLGTYLMISAACLYLSMVYLAEADRARVRAAKDARMDAEWMATQMQK